MEFKIKNISKFLPIFLVIVFVSSVFILTPIHQADASFWNWDIDETILNLISGILYIFITFFLWLAGLLVVIAAWLVDCFLHPVIYEQVFKSPAIDKGWTICRDMCNLFFVMLLLAIAFATIFRIQTYSAKALLPKFILAIFLINFSKVIATIVIDFGQIFMFEFVDWMVSFGEVSGSPGAMDALTATYKKYGSEFGLFNTAMGGWNSIDEMFTFDALLKVSFATIMTICMALVYFILAGLLLVRLVALVLLIVLSPFAFISVILPGTRSQSSKWWGSLFKYTMIGPIFVFFIFISSEMSKEMVGTGYFVNPPDDLGIIDTMLISSVQNIVVLGMLLASVFMTKSMGVAGSAAIIGGTAGIGLMAGKAYRGARYGKAKVGAVAGKPAKAAAAKLGVQTGVSRVKDWAGKGIRSNKVTNFIAGEFTLKNESERQAKNKEETDKYAKLYKNQGADYLREKVIDSKYTTPAQTAGAVQELQRTNKLTEEDVGKNIHNIKASGMDKEDFAKFAPQYAKDLGFGTKGQNSEEVTQEFTKKLIHDNETNKIGNLGLESGVVMSTMKKDHSDFSKYYGNLSTTDQNAAKKGISNMLRGYQEQINEASGGTATTRGTRNMSDINDTLLGAGVEVGNTGMTGNKLKEEIDKTLRTIAKNDENGHMILKDPEIDASGKIVLDVDGKIDFNAPGAQRNIAREEKLAGEMKAGKYKRKSENFFRHIGGHFGYSNFEQLRREEGEDKMKAAVEGQKKELKRLQKKKAKVALSTEESNKLGKINETIDRLSKNDYYKNLM